LRSIAYGLSNFIIKQHKTAGKKSKKEKKEKATKTLNWKRKKLQFMVHFWPSKDYPTYVSGGGFLMNRMHSLVF